MSCCDYVHRRSQEELQKTPRPNESRTTQQCLSNVSTNILNFMTPPPPLTLYGEN